MAGDLAALFKAGATAGAVTEVRQEPAVVSPPATLEETVDALRATRDADVILQGELLPCYTDYYSTHPILAKGQVTLVNLQVCGVSADG